jgi:hypothetical protein
MMVQAYKCSALAKRILREDRRPDWQQVPGAALAAGLLEDAEAAADQLKTQLDPAQIGAAEARIGAFMDQRAKQAPAGRIVSWSGPCFIGRGPVMEDSWFDADDLKTPPPR